MDCPCSIGHSSKTTKLSLPESWLIIVTGSFNLIPKSLLRALSSGFSVGLFLDQANYMLAKLSKNAGAKIVVHDPSLPALPDEYGIDMQPNTASSIAIQTVNCHLHLYFYNAYFALSMGSHHSLRALLVLHEKLDCFYYPEKMLRLKTF